MEDRTHHVLVLEPDVDDALRLCEMIESVASACDLYVWHLDTSSVAATPVVVCSPDVILLEADLYSEAELTTITDVCLCADVPVVVVTAAEDAESHQRALGRGAAACLIKWQFDDTALARCLNNVINPAA